MRTLQVSRYDHQFKSSLCNVIINFNQINQKLIIYNQTSLWFFINNSFHETSTLMSTQTQPHPIMDFFRHHALTSVIAISSVSAAIFYYLNYHQASKILQKPLKTPLRKRVKTQPLQQQNFMKQEQQINQELKHLKSTREKLIMASKEFKIQFLEEEILTSLLTEECVLNLFDKCIELVDENELNRIYETSRKARRTIFQKTLINAEIKQMNRKQSLQSLQSHQGRPSFPSPMQMTTPRNLKSIKKLLQKNTPISYPQALTFSEMYYRFVCTFEEEFKYLIEKTQKDFAAFLNIDFSLITESIDFHIAKENNEYFKQKIEEWTSSIREMLKHKLVNYVSPIEPNKIRQILAYQVDYLHQKRQKLRQTIHKLGISNEEELDALPTLLATILEDEVFFRFGIEQEQMTVEIMHLSKNKELQMLVQQFQVLTETIAQEMYQEVNKDAIVDDYIEDA